MAQLSDDLIQGYLGYQYGKDDLPLSAVQKDELPAMSCT
ncbi:hypothetical protein PORUE0001_1954 [Porphyromonas uenonis 60-3]|uniref:Uncharacterized protein n=1 Tax=Porphyromonas uenonis 60-3 TaxID=596327 RepID=C2MBC4_9PORP|nr:hypothetical protein PORUE0001_1954 [Porphyromonas uenonis 60-3]